MADDQVAGRAAGDLQRADEDDAALEQRAEHDRHADDRLLEHQRADDWRPQQRLRAVAVPGQLFSHRDQELQWQTSIEDGPSKTGWGGRTADLLYSLNGNNTVTMNISVAGSNTFEVGTIIEYSVSTNGAASLNLPTPGTGPARLQALKVLLNPTTRTGPRAPSPGR